MVAELVTQVNQGEILLSTPGTRTHLGSWISKELKDFSSFSAWIYGPYVSLFLYGVKQWDLKVVP